MSLNAPSTITPTQRVSQLATERGTIKVPMTLTAAVSTSRAPTTAATSRATIGTAMGISSDLDEQTIDGHRNAHLVRSSPAPAPSTAVPAALHREQHHSGPCSGTVSRIWVNLGFLFFLSLGLTCAGGTQRQVR